MRKKLISLDFDGVLHSYTSGWKGADVIPDGPVPGAMDFLRQLVEDGRFEVVIHSSRCSSPAGMKAIAMWLNECLWQAFGYDQGSKVAESIRIVDAKPPAHLTLDDRAITFDGEWPELDELAAFQPWNKKPAAAPALTVMGGITDRDRMMIEAIAGGLAEGEAARTATTPIAENRENEAYEADIEAAALALLGIEDQDRSHTIEEKARAVVDAFLGRAGFNVFKGEYEREIEGWISDEAEARLEEYSLGRAVIDGRPVWTLSSGWVVDTLSVEDARLSLGAIRDFVKGIADELGAPIGGTVTLTHDPDGRPVVDGTPAMSVEEMPEVVDMDIIQPAQARNEFLQSMTGAARHWARQPNLTEIERCEGVVFSVLNILDGTDGGPGYDVSVSPAPDDGEEYASSGYVTGVPINDCMLHEVWKR